MQTCENCDRPFYFNSHEPSPFPRLSRKAAEKKGLDILHKAERVAMEHHRQTSDEESLRLGGITTALERIQLTNRILIIALLIQIFSGYFLARQVDLHDFGQPAVIALLVLFFFTAALILLQLFHSGRLRRRRDDALEKLHSSYSKLLDIQRQIDLLFVGTSSYSRI
jgi:hypothetical protein